MKRIFVFFLSLLLSTALLFSGCSGNASSTPASSTASSEAASDIASNAASDATADEPKQDAPSESTPEPEPTPEPVPEPEPTYKVRVNSCQFKPGCGQKTSSSNVTINGEVVAGSTTTTYFYEADVTLTVTNIGNQDLVFPPTISACCGTASRSLSMHSNGSRKPPSLRTRPLPSP